MSRPLYVSDTYPQCKARRLRRIKRAASPVLWRAYEDGKISLHATEAIANKLAARAQNRWLETELERRRRKTEGQHTAAAVIMDFLGAGRIDLGQISEAIRNAIRYS